MTRQGAADEAVRLCAIKPDHITEMVLRGRVVVRLRVFHEREIRTEYHKLMEGPTCVA